MPQPWALLQDDLHGPHAADEDLLVAYDANVPLDSEVLAFDRGWAMIVGSMGNWSLCKLADMHDLVLRLHDDAMGKHFHHLALVMEAASGEHEVAVGASRGSDGQPVNMVVSIMLKVKLHGGGPFSIEKWIQGGSGVQIGNIRENLYIFDLGGGRHDPALGNTGEAAIFHLELALRCTRAYESWGSGPGQ